MRFAGFLVVGGAFGCSGDPPPAPESDVLVYSRTLGHRHADSIEAARGTLPAELAAAGLNPAFSEDPAVFTPDGLSRFRAVVFLYTSGNDILDADGKAAFEAFVAAGGGWVGIHSASDTEYAWPFYQELVVAAYAGHPPIQRAVVDVIDTDHPSLRHVGNLRWAAIDEWYNFARNPADVAGVEVLAAVDERTYEGGNLGAHHPIVWAHERLGGRALYSAMGHWLDRWASPIYVEHVTAAIAWAAKQ